MAAPSNSPLKPLVRFASRTYLLDWLAVVLFKASLYLLHFVITPVHQQFTLSDLRISHPYADPERVTTWQNLIYSAFVPAGLILVWALVFRPGVHQAHVTILGLVVSILLSHVITNIIKNAVGRPRPDLLARCIAKLDTPADKLVGIEVCTNVNSNVLNDGWRSFPSGHSALAFAGLGYLALFLMGQLHTLRVRLPRPDLARALISFVPLVGAALIALSRIADYRHDKYDVAVGSVIGFASALFAYRLYYKPLRSAQSQEVWPSRADAHAQASRRSRIDKDLEEQSLDDILEDDLDELTEDDVPADTHLLRTGE